MVSKCLGHVRSTRSGDPDMAQESLVRTLPGKKSNFFLTVKVFYKLPHICVFSSLGNTRPLTQSNKPFDFL